MKFDVSKVCIQPVGGMPLMNESKMLTVGDALAMSAIAKFDGDATQPMDKALLRYRLKQKLISVEQHVAGGKQIVELSDDERKVLKDCCKKLFSIDLFGQLHDFLDAPITLEAVPINNAG